MLGKKNMVFGFFYFVCTLGLGMYLAQKMGSGGPLWASSKVHHVLATAHVHGNMEALLNIVVGYLLLRLPIKVAIGNAVSGLLIAGAVLHSGMFYITGLGLDGMTILAPAGAAFIVLAMALMGIGVALGSADNLFACSGKKDEDGEI